MAIAIANSLAAMILVIANSYQYIALATRVYRYYILARHKYAPHRGQLVRRYSTGTPALQTINVNQNSSAMCRYSTSVNPGESGAEVYYAY